MTIADLNRLLETVPDHFDVVVDHEKFCEAEPVQSVENNPPAAEIILWIGY